MSAIYRWIFPGKKVGKKSFDQVRQIFLMGPRKSGKSTFFNQLKRIYGDEREMDEKNVQERKEMIELYVFHAIADILAAMPKLSPPIRLENLKNLALASWFIYHSKINFNVDKNKVVIFFNFLEFFKSLWNDQGFQSALRRFQEYNIPPHAKYFFRHIDRIFDKDYVPTEEDILKGYIFPSTTQKLDIKAADLKQRFYDRVSRQHDPNVGSVTYRVIDLCDQFDKQKCLPCLYSEDEKRDIDYVPWFRHRPKFTSNSILFFIDGSSALKMQEGFELLKTVADCYQCCCFMIFPVINTWDMISFKKYMGLDGTSFRDFMYISKREAADKVMQYKYNICPQYNRKCLQWIYSLSMEVTSNVLSTKEVNCAFRTCCDDIEKIEMRAQFEEELSTVKHHSSVLHFDCTFFCMDVNN